MSAEQTGGSASTTLQERVNAFPYWYHRIDLPGGVVTPGWAPINPTVYHIPADLSGKRVLDVGAWDGYWTFEALKRGASQVVAIDDFSDYLGKIPEQNRKAWGTFDLCRDALGYDEQRCQRHDLNLYDLTPEMFGKFDVVFCFGVIYHLRHPLLGIDKLSAVCDGRIYVESAILDDFSPYRGGFNKGYPGGQMVMEFYPENQYGNNDTNWWVPTLQVLAQMLRAAGFTKNVNAWKLVPQPTSLSHCRGFATASK